MATSFWRPVARVSRRLATFAQAISSTSVTDPRRTRTARRTLPTTCSSSGTTLMVNVLSRLSFSRMFAAITLMSACACSTVTPGLSRAIRL